mmetsp:Transcript_28280/g.72111  ORF Transcript_28280/g.72111 Transcript_28280/m.72111 type:complete len:317 (-) Transcript_28280:602-1552(-)
MTSRCSLSDAMATTSASGASGKAWRRVVARLLAASGECAPSSTTQGGMVPGAPVRAPTAQGGRGVCSICSRPGMCAACKPAVMASSGMSHPSDRSLAHVVMAVAMLSCWCAPTSRNCSGPALQSAGSRPPGPARRDTRSRSAYAVGSSTVSYPSCWATTCCAACTSSHPLSRAAPCSTAADASCTWRDTTTGRPGRMMPALAAAMDAREPPSASTCSYPSEVMTAAPRLSALNTLVASYVPPMPVSITPTHTPESAKCLKASAVVTSKWLSAPPSAATRTRMAPSCAATSAVKSAGGSAQPLTAMRSPMWCRCGEV